MVSYIVNLSDSLSITPASLQLSECISADLKLRFRFTPLKVRATVGPLSQEHLYGGSFKCAISPQTVSYLANIAETKAAKLNSKLGRTGKLSSENTIKPSSLCQEAKNCMHVCVCMLTLSTAPTHTNNPNSPPQATRPQMALMGLSASPSWWSTSHTSEWLLLLQERCTLCRCSRRFEGIGDDGLIVFIHAIFKTHLWINATLARVCILLCAQIMQHLAKWRCIHHTYSGTTL